MLSCSVLLPSPLRVNPRDMLSDLVLVLDKMISALTLDPGQTLGSIRGDLLSQILKLCFNFHPVEPESFIISGSSSFQKAFPFIFIPIPISGPDRIFDCQSHKPYVP